jgi:hypothetical protein
VDLREERVPEACALGLPEPWCPAGVAAVLPAYQGAANLPVLLA